MKIYKMCCHQDLPISLEQSWDFFSDPRNLEKITPKELGFHITSDVSQGMRNGMLISYRLRLPTRNQMTWVTEIKHVDPPHGFVDEQRFGPYRFWYHEHRFRQVRDSVRCEDIVNYALPFGPLGRCAHALFVRRELEKIFNFRKVFLDDYFNTRKDGDG
tara:strand:+ start:852 stop:1328 length:477 start_codon:yes stop_codon:yes gene_type:complete